MKILLLNCGYRDGSTGNVVGSISDVLRAEGHDVFTCYGLGNPDVDRYGKKVCSNAEHTVNALIMRLSGIPFGGFHYSNVRIKKIIRTFQPDVVNVHCMNATTVNLYSLFRFLAASNIKTVITLHAEIYHTAGCEHAFDCTKWIEGCHHCATYRNKSNSWFFDTSSIAYAKMKDAIHSFKPENLTITAVSPWLAERAKMSSIMRGYNVVSVANGIKTTVFHNQPSQGLIQKEGYKKTVLFVTAYISSSESDNKGGRFLPVIAKSLPEYKFIAVYSRTIDNIPEMPENVHLWGRANGQTELAQMYSEADITLVLSHRETFSMVTAESLCCGTPVVGFCAGGPESIALPEYSRFVEYGDVQQIVNALQSLNTDNIDKNVISQQAVAHYSQETMAQHYLKVYNI